MAINENDIVLDAYEQELEDGLTLEHLQNTNTINETTRAYWMEFARQSIENKKKLISIRIPQSDIIAVKAKAQELGLSYQTLINMLVRQYVAGKVQLEL